MVEINNQRKAFLDMLAWFWGIDNGRQKTRNHGCWRHCRRRAIYWLLRSPSQTCHAKPKTQINRRRRRFFPVGWMSPQAAWPESISSPKSQDAVALQQRLRSVALSLMIDRGDIRQANRPLYSNIWASLLALVMVWSIRLTAWLQNSKKRRNGQRDWCNEQKCDYLRSGYLHHRSPVMGC